jgi:hypothetical protein
LPLERSEWANPPSKKKICTLLTSCIENFVSLDNNVFCSTLSEFENFLLCERILINVTTCQNETSSKFLRF